MNKPAESSLLWALDYRTKAFGAEALSDTGSAMRLMTPQEGIGGLAIDRYAATIVFEWSQATDPSALLCSLLPTLKSRCGAQSFVLKRCIRDRSQLGSQFTRTVHFGGDPPPTHTTITENSLVFSIRPNEGFSTGLFLDHRNNRKFLSLRCQPGLRVLNLFAYTCSFSVYCASSGAHTVNVDISRKALEWGRLNYSLNSLPTNYHRFLCRDSLEALESFSKHGERFDLIIIDPPSFSRTNKGRPFSVQRDFSRLVLSASECLAAHGIIFASVNCRSLISSGLPAPRKDLRDVSKELPARPEDFSRGLATMTSSLYTKTDNG